jgi:hypothetical protein
MVARGHASTNVRLRSTTFCGTPTLRRNFFFMNEDLKRVKGVRREKLGVSLD